MKTKYITPAMDHKFEEIPKGSRVTSMTQLGIIESLLILFANFILNHSLVNGIRTKCVPVYQLIYFYCLLS